MGFSQLSQSDLAKYGFTEKDKRTYGELKDSAHTYLENILANVSEKNKVAICLVDIQNDFTRKAYRGTAGESVEGKLYVEGGEKTILSNMALLEALDERLTVIRPDIRENISVLVTMDAHRTNREKGSVGALELSILAEKYPDTWPTVRTTEIQELKPINPAENSFGEHCIVGTPGADIAAPIEALLAEVAQKVEVIRFGKINFDATQAGMELRAGVKLSESEGADIYAENPRTFVEVAKKFNNITFTGICGEVCVQQSAEGTKKALPEVSVNVLGSLSHYLTSDNVARVMESYAGLKINPVLLNGKESSNALSCGDPAGLGKALDNFIKGGAESTAVSSSTLHNLYKPAIGEVPYTQTADNLAGVVRANCNVM